MAAERVLRAANVVKALHGAFCRGAPSAELFQLATTKIVEAGPPFDRGYMYLLTQDALNLVASAGQAAKLDTVALPNNGVEGQAVTQRQDVYVPDTSSAGCDTHFPDTRSKLVVLIRRHDVILGVIAIESDAADGFSDAQQVAVREVADGLAALL
ncbi:MAG: GAF domain-containing protein [Gemmatimonadales bacterium]